LVVIRKPHGSLVTYEFESLRSRRGLSHAVFARHGGVSPAPWQSLNLSRATGDSAANIAENFRRVCGAFGLTPSDAVTSVQEHGNKVAAVAANQRGERLAKFDGLVTDIPGTLLVQLYADCPPVLLYDPVRHAAGIAHAGWRGTLAGIATQMVEALSQAFGSRPADLVAAIGPAIGACCYSVGEEVRQAFTEKYADAARWLHSGADGRIYLDLWEANRAMLLGAGVSEVEVAGICTSCRVDDFYSARRENRRNGCFGAAIVLERAA
jgi:purine-nucleoside/S-methyl-5'-thioadenosine phosphorylase / adenosine deaminase